MDIKTKYDIGDNVWIICRGSSNKALNAIIDKIEIQVTTKNKFVHIFYICKVPNYVKSLDLTMKLIETDVFSSKEETIEAIKLL